MNESFTTPEFVDQAFDAAISISGNGEFPAE